MVIVGDPIAQVKSPAGITAALQERGRNVVVIPVHVTEADLSDLLAGLDGMHNLDAILVTVPHKFACYRHCKTATPRAHALGAVSILRRNADGTWHGEMLDGQGFVDATCAHGCRIDGRTALLVGAGGAGSAIGLELLDRGAAGLAVHDIDAARRDRLVAKLAQHYPGKVGAGSAEPRGFDIVAHASPCGMQPSDPLPIDVAGLRPTTFVGCVITAPTVSPLVARARAMGCPSSVGGDMFQAERVPMLDFLQAAG
jgi:shikimate dehydrogenase